MLQIRGFRLSFQRLFWLVMLLQFCMWSILPVFIRHSVSNDLIEALTWGRQFQWGYDKNPFLPGFVAYLGGLFGTSGFGIYAIQQLFILLGAWSVRALTFELSGNAAYAFIASVASLLCAAYNIEVQIYNDNYLLQGLLPFSALFFYRGQKNDDLKQWLFSGIILGLATLAKYSAILYLPVYALYLLSSPQGRKCFFSIKPYLALLSYSFVLLPNILYLYQQDFDAISYAFLARGLLHQLVYTQYLVHNADFLFATLIQTLPMLLAVLMAIEYKKNTGLTCLTYSVLTPAQNRLQQVLSGLLGLGPMSLLFMLATVFGFALHREWGTTFIGFLGSTVLVTFKPAVSQHSMTRFTLFLVAVMLSFGLGYIVIAEKKDSGAYPGPEIARYATQLWHQHDSGKLSYVAGDRYTAGYIGYYSADKPAVWMEWNSHHAPWVNEKELRCKGALFVIESGHTVLHLFKGHAFPAFVRDRFPTLTVFPLQSFAWYRHRTRQRNVVIRFGLLAPDKVYCSA